MADIGSPVVAHSLAEVCLYLELTPCPKCGSGGLSPDGTALSGDPARGTLIVPVTCGQCGARMVWRFEVQGLPLPESNTEAFAAWTAGEPIAELSVINPTDAPSQAIDLAGWLTLHERFERQARRAAQAAATLQQREAARRLQMRAAACLDEALKFYDADNDLPPEDAFFAEGARELYRERPELFVWDRLIALRGRLPR